MRRALLPLFLLPLLTSASARAATDFPLPLELDQPKPDVLRYWEQNILWGREAVERGKGKSVRTTMDDMISEMLARIERGEPARKLLASAVLVRALAQAAVGAAADAVWDHSVAMALDPEFEGFDLEQEGPAGSALAALVEKDVASLGSFDPVAGGGFGGTTSLVTPPRKLRAPAPQYPRGKRIACIEEAIRVHGILDREGRIRRPTVPEGGDPSLIYVALEALREWRFEPARYGGEPLIVGYNVTVNFSLPRTCPGR